MSKRFTYEELEQRINELEQEAVKHKQVEEKLLESEERWKIIFDYAPDIFCLCDLKGNFIDGNIAAIKMIGYRKEELIGKNFLKLKLNILCPKMIPKAAKHLAKNSLGLPGGPDEFTLIRKDGSRVEVEICFYPVTVKGKESLVLGIARDITLRKKAEKKLLKAKNELTKRVKERTAELEKAVEQMEKEIKVRKRAEEKGKRLIDDLEEALSEVKLLKGFLPICSNCKKIRDDKGNWQGIEKYIQERSGAKFSHSICPECVKKLYPDMNIYEDD